jgi:hypothetical protein
MKKHSFHVQDPTVYQLQPYPTPCRPIRRCEIGSTAVLPTGRAVEIPLISRPWMGGSPCPTRLSPNLVPF